ncbi:MAG: LysR family transcriptional regulator [Parasphingorhabdus sp.]
MLGAQNLDWEEVKSFAVVSDAGSVRRAARALGVHHSTVSRRIDNLEHALGTKLFDRRPEGFVLNSAGEEFVSAVRDCGTRLNRAERSISGKDGDMSGVVRVTMAEPIAVHTIGPRLAEFADEHPGIEVHMIATTNILDVSRREADIAIRVDNNPPESLVGKRIVSYNQTVYATTEYLKSQDFENDPESARWLSWEAEEEKFPDWTKETEFSKVPMWGYFPGPAMQLSGAKAGLGIAMLPCFIGDRDPKLVRATNRKPIKARDIWLLTHSDLRRTARIRAFMTFAEKVLRDAKHEFLGTI